MTFPGGFTDGEKTAKQKDLKHMRISGIYMQTEALNGLKRPQILLIRSPVSVFPIIFSQMHC